MAKEETVKKSLFSVGRVITGSEPVILDGDGKELSVHEALVRALNDLEELKNGLLR